MRQSEAYSLFSRRPSHHIGQGVQDFAKKPKTNDFQNIQRITIVSSFRLFQGACQAIWSRASHPCHGRRIEGLCVDRHQSRRPLRGFGRAEIGVAVIAQTDWPAVWELAEAAAAFSAAAVHMTWDTVNATAWARARRFAGAPAEAAGYYCRPAVTPPSTGSTAPVIHDALSEARNRIASAMSAG